MRTNLLVNFKDKDKVKALGAKWDIGRRVWYIENVENIRPFMPWIPEYLKKPTATKTDSSGPKKSKPRSRHQQRRLNNLKKNKNVSKEGNQRVKQSPAPAPIVAQSVNTTNIFNFESYFSAELDEIVTEFPHDLQDPPQPVRTYYQDGYYCDQRFNTHIKYGCLHHEIEPAVTNKVTKTMSWWLYGLRHREDGPAIYRPKGLCEWFWQGKRHRNNGPAVANQTTGHQEYWYHGKRHRIGGPAIIRSNGTTEWWIDGVHMTTEQLAELVAAIEIKRITRFSLLRPNWHTKFLGLSESMIPQGNRN